MLKTLAIAFEGRAKYFRQLEARHPTSARRTVFSAGEQPARWEALKAQSAPTRGHQRARMRRSALPALLRPNSCRNERPGGLRLPTRTVRPTGREEMIGGRASPKALRSRNLLFAASPRARVRYRPEALCALRRQVRAPLRRWSPRRDFAASLPTQETCGAVNGRGRYLHSVAGRCRAAPRAGRSLVAAELDPPQGPLAPS